MATNNLQALKHFLSAPQGEDEKSLDMAIETVGRAHDDHLTHMLVEYLMGETDGVPKVGSHSHMVTEPVCVVGLCRCMAAPDLGSGGGGGNLGGLV